MNTIHSAANSASQILFGDSTTGTTGQKQYQKQDGVNVPTTDTNNPLRSADNTNTPHHTTDNNSIPGNVPNGSGTKHTAGSGLNGVQLNKPHNSESGSTGPTPPVGPGPLGPAPTSDRPTDTPAFEHSGEPATTTSTFEKPPVGDYNRDGTRHKTSDVNQSSGVFDSEDQPTTSNVTGSRFSEDITPTEERLDTPSTNRLSDTGIANQSSTTSYGAHKHVVDPIHSDSTPSHSFNERPGASQGGNESLGFASDAAEGKRHSNPDIRPRSGPFSDASDFNQSDRASTFSRDSTSNQNPNSDLLQGKRDTPHERRPEEPTPTEDSIQPRINADTSTSAAPTSPIGAAGGGPGIAVEPSVDVDTSSGQCPTPKQGTNRPQETPETHTPETEEKKSEGTGEKYEKSTGMAAEGGDFDASRPGAGREADRILDQKGIGHGKGGPNQGAPQTTPLHSKLLPHSKKDKDVPKPAGYEPVEQPMAETDTSEHKGLTTKIKEKLHVGHR
jgi:hypothetical protein